MPAALPRVPAEVFRDLRGTAPTGELDDLIRAFVAAGEALERDDLPRALQLLTWAKATAQRSAVIREALGVALYLAGDYAAATSELQTYRRLSGRNDQNHLLADCARATGRRDKVREAVEGMDPARDGADRWVEGLIVLAADLADAGDLEGARGVLGRAGLDPERIEPWHPRLWYAAADLAQRAGDSVEAAELFGAIVAVDEEFLDAAQRLAALEDGT